MLNTASNHGILPSSALTPERPNVRRTVAYQLQRQDGRTRQMKVLFLRLTPFMISIYGSM